MFLKSSCFPQILELFTPFKTTTGSHCTLTQITKQLPACLKISSQILCVDCLLLSHQNQSSVNDCRKMMQSACLYFLFSGRFQFSHSLFLYPLLLTVLYTVLYPQTTVYLSALNCPFLLAHVRPFTLS
jgi:hypothetical protein